MELKNIQAMYDFIKMQLGHLPTKQECIDFGMKAGAYNELFPTSNASSRIYGECVCALSRTKGETVNSGFHLRFKMDDAVDSIKTTGKKGTDEYKETPCKMLNCKVVPYVGEDKKSHADSNNYYTINGIKYRFERVIHVRLFPLGSDEPEETPEETTEEEVVS
jgi:hypothetical protein